MPRTNVTKKQIRAPYNDANNTALFNKFAEHDSALDAIESGGTIATSQIHHVRSASTGNAADLAAFTVTNDGVTLVAGDRVLLKDQTNAEENGIYVVGTVGSGTAPLTRATDWDGAVEIKQDTLVAVAEGTANANLFYMITGVFPATVGTTDQTFIAQWNTTAVLSADGPGRALMADDLFDAATVARVVDAKAIDTGSIADSAIEALQINAAAVTEPKVAPSILTAKHCAVGAAGATVGVIDAVFPIASGDGSTVLDALTLDATYGKIEIDDVWFKKGPTTGGTTDAVQLCTDAGGTTAITSSLALNSVAEGGIVRTTSLLNTALAAGAHLYVKRTKTTNNAGTFYVKAHRVA